jgi:hypothetical protein
MAAPAANGAVKRLTSHSGYSATGWRRRRLPRQLRHVLAAIHATAAHGTASNTNYIAADSTNIANRVTKHYEEDML